jgi:hypothetical protein
LRFTGGENAFQGLGPAQSPRFLGDQKKRRGLRRMIDDMMIRNRSLAT